MKFHRGFFDENDVFTVRKKLKDLKFHAKELHNVAFFNTLRLVIV